MAEEDSVRALSCPACGGTIALRAAGYTVTLACEYCGTLIDATDPAARYPDMAAVVRDLGPVLVMMHAKDGPLPHATDRPVAYRDVVREVGDWLLARADVAVAAGIDPDQIVLDPGWGRFLSLDPAHSWEMLARFDELVARVAPLPVMVGISRKGFFGVPLAERDPLSQLTSLVAVEQGAALIRTHDVRMAAQFLGAAERMRRPLPARAVYV